ncbi:roundabout homolog 3-like [Anopheles maculipalpis]|uniref:roundabout homolog 3-like n=1 Tax=Anopheles maculipalpis TaxID=1496333 RepID=UPI002158B6E9|nr:roundabout homolog 3-like [Anopheles maculipalpis]
MTISETERHRSNASGNPQPSVFLKEGSQTLMFPNNTYDNMQVSVQGTLQIRGVQKDDDGYYICSALSVAGSTTSRAYLQVLTRSDSNLPPILQIVPTNQTLPRGTVATPAMPCHVGNPTPMIRWMKNATDINLSGGNGRFSIIQGGTLRNWMGIPNAKQSLEGDPQHEKKDVSCEYFVKRNPCFYRSFDRLVEEAV